MWEYEVKDKKREETKEPKQKEMRWKRKNCGGSRRV